MAEKHQPFIPPGARIDPSSRLVIWHPHGLLDAALADDILRFLEFIEGTVPDPCNRFVDFSEVNPIHLSFDEIEAISARRIDAYTGAPVKSAILAISPLAFGIARMYEQLMDGSRIEVRVFRDRKSAATWLNIAAELLVKQ